MNTTFDFDAVFPPERELNSLTYVKRKIAEEKQRCDQIDKRISFLEKEFSSLVAELEKAKALYLNTAGFINRKNIWKQMKPIIEKIAINRDLRKYLYNERWLNT